jgi:tetratricopeptide (TPR) repeat protein
MKTIEQAAKSRAGARFFLFLLMCAALYSCAGFRDWVAEPGDFGAGGARRSAGQYASPSSVTDETAAGIALYNEGSYDRAVAAFTRALKKEPRNPYALNWRGFVLRLQGKYGKAVADHSAALKAKPDREDRFNALYHRGLAYYYKGHVNLAAADYTEALLLNPHDAPALNLRGAAYFDGQNYDKAVADYTAVLRISPDDTDARSALERLQRIRREPRRGRPQRP